MSKTMIMGGRDGDSWRKLMGVPEVAVMYKLQVGALREINLSTNTNAIVQGNVSDLQSKIYIRKLVYRLGALNLLKRRKHTKLFSSHLILSISFSPAPGPLIFL